MEAIPSNSNPPKEPSFPKACKWESRSKRICFLKPNISTTPGDLEYQKFLAQHGSKVSIPPPVTVTAPVQEPPEEAQDLEPPEEKEPQVVEPPKEPQPQVLEPKKKPKKYWTPPPKAKPKLKPKPKEQDEGQGLTDIFQVYSSTSLLKMTKKWKEVIPPPHKVEPASTMSKKEEEDEDCECYETFLEDEDDLTEKKPLLEIPSLFKIETKKPCLVPPQEKWIRKFKRVSFDRIPSTPSSMVIMLENDFKKKKNQVDCCSSSPPGGFPKKPSSSHHLIPFCTGSNDDLINRIDGVGNLTSSGSKTKLLHHPIEKVKGLSDRLVVMSSKSPHIQAKVLDSCLRPTTPKCRPPKVRPQAVIEQTRPSGIFFPPDEEDKVRIREQLKLLREKRLKGAEAQGQGMMMMKHQHHCCIKKQGWIPHLMVKEPLRCPTDKVLKDFDKCHEKMVKRSAHHWKSLRSISGEKAGKKSKSRDRHTQSREKYRSRKQSRGQNEEAASKQRSMSTSRSNDARWSKQRSMSKSKEAHRRHSKHRGSSVSRKSHHHHHSERRGSSKSRKAHHHHHCKYHGSSGSNHQQKEITIIL